MSSVGGIGQAALFSAEGQRIQRQLQSVAVQRAEFVCELRLEFGVSWANVGYLLGVSGESLRQQYGDAVQQLAAQLEEGE